MHGISETFERAAEVQRGAESYTPAEYLHLPDAVTAQFLPCINFQDDARYMI
jgi:hypothetical protein